MTEDGALVSFGYYSDAVEGEYVFLVCDDDDNILDTTDEPYFDFATFGSAGTYHVWGLSYQEGWIWALWLRVFLCLGRLPSDATVCP